MIKTSLIALLLLLPQLALAANDPRMQIELVADESKGITVESLHGNIRKAADLALPQLWKRMLLQDDKHLIPEKTKAVLFLQRATPTEDGLRVIFNQRRVTAFLKKHNIPFIETYPTWLLSVQMSNSSNRSMPESAAMLQELAASSAAAWGYGLEGSRESLILHWRWLDSSHISLSVRGTSKLGEYSETREVASGDPFQQLEPWLIQTLLKARNSYATSAPGEAEVTNNDAATNGIATKPAATREFLTLAIERQASLPEQVLFEEELRRDPRILDLSLKQVNRDGQQYRLRLKNSDDQWLSHWFKRRGLKLTPTIEGWVAR